MGGGMGVGGRGRKTTPHHEQRRTVRPEGSRFGSGRRVGSIELQQVSVWRGDRSVLENLDLVVADGERLALLGPSGAGKSTLLRAVAGIDPVARGRVRIDGRDVTDAPTRDRDLAMVNQQASLQPHLDVRRNVAFPLMVRHTDPAERDARVKAEARAFSLGGVLGRKPRALSGGERREVALARSLVRRVGALLLDEPFADTDGLRRSSLVTELIRIQEGYGVTLVCATNDQRVAMGLAHRCAVLNDGRIVQVARPTELFARPANVFVAGFLGTPPMNLLPGRVERAAGGVRVVAGPFRLQSFLPRVSDLVGMACTVGIRPTDLRYIRPGDVAALEEPVRAHAFLGGKVEVRLGTRGEELVAVLDRPAPEPGRLLRLGIDPADIHLFGPDGAAVSHGI